MCIITISQRYPLSSGTSLILRHCWCEILVSARSLPESLLNSQIHDQQQVLLVALLTEQNNTLYDFYLNILLRTQKLVRAHRELSRHKPFDAQIRNVGSLLWKTRPLISWLFFNLLDNRKCLWVFLHFLNEDALSSVLMWKCLIHLPSLNPFL